MGVLSRGEHELFAQKWHEKNNKTEAYKYAFPEKCAKWKEETINKRASELSLTGEVSGRYKELTQESADNHGVTIAGLILELNTIKGIALGAETPQASAAISAVMNKAKLCGLDVQKIETKTTVVDKSELNW